MRDSGLKLLLQIKTAFSSGPIHFSETQTTTPVACHKLVKSSNNTNYGFVINFTAHGLEKYQMQIITNFLALELVKN